MVRQKMFPVPAARASVAREQREQTRSRAHVPLICRQDGVALIAVLLLTAVMLALAAFGSRTAQIELHIANNDLLARRALDAAEAGINHSFNVMNAEGDGSFNDELTGGGTGGSLAALGTVTTLSDGKQYRFRPFGGGANDGYYVRVEDDYDEQKGANDPTTDRNGRINIISHGRVGGAERVIQAQVSGASMFQYGLFGKTFVSLGGSSTVDSYDSRNGGYSPLTARSNGDTRTDGNISMNGSASIQGDGIASGTVSGTVTGTVIQNAPPLNFPPVPPCGPPYSSGTGISGGSYNSTTGALSGDATLTGGTYCFSSISQSGHDALTITAPVIVYVTGPVDLTGGGVVNTTGSAANFLLLASTPSGTNFSLKGGTQAYLAAYAPNADLSFVGTSDMYGSLVGGSVNKTGNSGFHYDESLASVVVGPLQLTKWHELRSN